MATSNAERVGKALDLLNQGMRPFVERELHAIYGERWMQEVAANLREYQMPAARTGEAHWDTQALLLILWNQWHTVFGKVLGHSERSIVSELREVRNRWAHQETFSNDDAYRALDSIQRLLTAISAHEQASEIDKQKQELLRLRFEEQRSPTHGRQPLLIPLEGQPSRDLRPWREIVTPHPDVASGRYQVAEFAANLGDVHRGGGAEEYHDPRAFFLRTYLTAGLKDLLTNAVERLSGSGGDPVIELQTNFGGGKTHALLALYHLFSGVALSELPGIEPVLQSAGVSRPPQAHRAVLVGFELSPGQPEKKPDGTIIHTLWGELAYQLLGKDGYALVAEADRQGVSPGSEVLRELFTRAAPCLVLIDEWIVYVRQLYNKVGLPGGSFDANLSFVQALTEAAKVAPRTLVVATIPESESEAGGESGQEALKRLKNVFGRVESPWRPASTEEGFEIVRRRLFQPIAEPRLLVARDAVIKAFSDLYGSHPQEFPAECRETDYLRRMASTYPLHPEVFDRLYQGWASLDRFQRTRGVLRLMAAVIHSLWENQDAGLMILPASVPVGDDVVENRFMDYLEDPWRVVMERDVDGPSSLPLRLDREHPTQGRYSAGRRVARTIFFGSAPTLGFPPEKRGIIEQQIKLGCVQPGESVTTFGDAQRRLTDQATFVYLQNGRYWYSTQPSINRMANDRAAQFSKDRVFEEIERRLRLEQSKRGEFDRVHPCPTSSADIPDEYEARLVIVRPHSTHALKDAQSAAHTEVAKFLVERGTSPRQYHNALVFLAADRARLEDLEEAVRQYLAWQSIEREEGILNLDRFQADQAKKKRAEAEDIIEQRMPEAYCWLLAPAQSPQDTEIEWQEFRLQGGQVQEGLAVRAARKLKGEGQMHTQWAGTLLRLELDRIPLWRGNHVSLKDLKEYFAKYPYLPRLKHPEALLLEATRDGVASSNWQRETFAYADSWDAERQRYRGLRAGQMVNPLLEGLLVKPDVAERQLEEERKPVAPEPPIDPPKPPEQPGGLGGGIIYSPPGPGNGGVVREPEGPGVVVATALPHRFYGSVTLDAIRMGRDATQIAQEVVQHLTKLLGAEVEITLEIHAKVPDGVPEQVVRTVNENCRTLHFKQFDFEES